MKTNSSGRGPQNIKKQWFLLYSNFKNKPRWPTKPKLINISSEDDLQWKTTSNKFKLEYLTSYWPLSWSLSKLKHKQRWTNQRWTPLEDQLKIFKVDSFFYNQDWYLGKYIGNQRGNLECGSAQPSFFSFSFLKGIIH